MKEVIIKISDEMYERVMKNVRSKIPLYGYLQMHDAILGGKVLPKGHDALLDRGEILKHEVLARIGEDYEEYAVPVDSIGEVIPIIEADEEANDE